MSKSNELSEAGRVLSAENESTLRQVYTMLQKLLKKGGSPVRKTAQGMQDAAKPGKTTPQGMREAQLSEAGQNGLSFSEIGGALQSAIRERLGGGYPWIRDIFADAVVYQTGYGDECRLYRCAYAIDAAGAVALGDAEIVTALTLYVPAAEDGALIACPYCGGDMAGTLPMDDGGIADDAPPMTEAGAVELLGDLVPLNEKAARTSGGAILAKLIQPGWGSSGYYAKEVLQRDGPKVFPKGTHMYLDHPTATEEALRPERSVKDLAATLMSDAAWNDNGWDGPGLYADISPIAGMDGVIEAIAPATGLSIRADGRVEEGEAEGRRGRLVTALVNGKSVDFVTRAGAGGKVKALAEAARGDSPTPPVVAPTQQEHQVNEQEAKDLRESIARLETQNARLAEALALRDAGEMAAQLIGASDLHAAAKTRLSTQIVKQAPIAEGALDRNGFSAIIEAAIAEERAYIAGLSESGRIVGMGTTTQAAAPSTEDATARLSEALADLGMGESTVKIAVKGR